MKRVFLFLLTNVLVIVTISFVMNLLGIQGYLTQSGIDHQALLIFCSLWGMGGAFISLLLSKTIAKWASGVKVIDPRRATGQEARLIDMVHGLARKARLPAMPEVGIYKSPEVNAFATGPSKRNSLVAVSSGLLDSMDDPSLEGVLGHEVAHIANGDMVTMTLLQGVVNAFVLFISRIIAFAISQAMRSDEEEGFGGGYMMHFIIVFVLDIIFSILGSIVVAAFSRWREFHADQGGARLAGKPNMISALRSLSQYVSRVESTRTSISSLKISSGKSGFMFLFSSHPPLGERIKRLEAARHI